MKVQNVLKKTIIATALAAVAAGASFNATAGVLTVAPAIIAEDIFGKDSETTVVALPTITFTSATLAASVVNTSTIKLTLGDDVVFGETYDSSANWAAQGVNIQVGAINLDETNSKVTAGGTSNNNQITITLTVDGLDLKNIQATGLKVKNLTQYLAPNTVREVTAAVEVRANNTGDTGLDVDTAPAGVVIVSAPGIVLKSDTLALAPNHTDGRVKISAEGDEARKLFTNPGVNAIPAVTNAQAFIDFGTLTIERNKVGSEPVKKEDNTLFDLVGADVINLRLKGSGDLQGYGNFTLIEGTAQCGTGTVVAAGTASAGTSDVVNINFSGTSSVINQPLRLCAQATGNSIISAQTSIEALLNVNYYSVRYIDFTRTAKFGAVELERGLCQVTLFNLPNVNAQDNAFIRFTNTSKVNGAVKASIWTQDGVKVDANTVILDNLDAHATAVFHTDATQTSGTYLGDVLPQFAQTSGRSRIVLEGEFQNCEAMGLVRTPNGTLTSMTSTVYSGSANNTSNTEN